jgi:hypothetical protein
MRRVYYVLLLALLVTACDTDNAPSIADDGAFMEPVCRPNAKV